MERMDAFYGPGAFIELNDGHLYLGFSIFQKSLVSDFKLNRR